MNSFIDRRTADWFRLRLRLPHESTDWVTNRWVEALSSLRWHDPEVFKKVMGRVLCDEPNKLKIEYLQKLNP